jgi:hypothetical protein
MAKSPHGRAVVKMAAEIGYICIHWGWLEDTIDFLIALLAPLEGEEVWNAITGNVDIRQKAQMLRALFFFKKPSDDWYDYAIETINTIDNDLRVRRNHLIHSSLHSTKGRLMRQKKGVKLTKPQSFQAPELRTIDIRPAKIKEARKLLRDILKHVSKCAWIYGFALHPDVLASRGISFRQFVRGAESSERRKRKRFSTSTPAEIIAVVISISCALAPLTGPV